jgi:hypothetical protein
MRWEIVTILAFCTFGGDKKFNLKKNEPWQGNILDIEPVIT